MRLGMIVEQFQFQLFTLKLIKTATKQTNYQNKTCQAKGVMDYVDLVSAPQNGNIS